MLNRLLAVTVSLSIASMSAWPALAAGHSLIPPPPPKKCRNITTKKPVTCGSPHSEVVLTNFGVSGPYFGLKYVGSTNTPNNPNPH
jgi:hypothetical protein